MGTCFDLEKQTSLSICTRVISDDMVVIDKFYDKLSWWVDHYSGSLQYLP